MIRIETEKKWQYCLAVGKVICNVGLSEIAQIAFTTFCPLITEFKLKYSHKIPPKSFI